MLRIWGPIAVVASSLLFGAAGSASAHPRDGGDWYGRVDGYRAYPAARHDRADWRDRDDRGYRRNGDVRNYRYDRDDRNYRYDSDDRRGRAYEDREWRDARARRLREEDRDRRW